MFLNIILKEKENVIYSISASFLYAGLFSSSSNMFLDS